VGVDDLVDLGHEADGFGEGDDDLLVVDDVVFRERAALAVFQPFLADLVAADMKIPHILAHAMEARGLRLVQPDGVPRPSDLLDLGIPAAKEFGNGLGELWRFQRLNSCEFSAKVGQGTKDVRVPWHWQSWPVALEPIAKVAGVRWRIKERKCIVENVERELDVDRLGFYHYVQVVEPRKPRPIKTSVLLINQASGMPRKYRKHIAPVVAGGDLVSAESLDSER